MEDTAYWGHPSGRSVPATPPTPPTRHTRSARSRSGFNAKDFSGDTLAGLDGLSNGIRDGALFRHEFSVGQCPSDGVRIVHTDIVLRRPRCRTADPCDPSARKDEVGPVVARAAGSVSTEGYNGLRTSLVGTLITVATQGSRGRMKGMDPDTVWSIITVITVAVALAGLL